LGNRARTEAEAAIAAARADADQRIAAAESAAQEQIREIVARAATETDELRAETDRRMSAIQAAAEEQVAQAHSDAEAARIAQTRAETEQHTARLV
jgi:hypothetical protein